jgi:hypothetical protein
MHMTQLAAAGIVAAAGLIRGITGFGGAMVMTPILALLVGPVAAVATVLILEAAGALVMFPDALPRVRWPTLIYLIIPAIFTVPFGGYLLLTLDPTIARKVIAAVVIVFSLVLLLGFRYSGSQRAVTSLALGSLVGVLLGATSVGAPPVILYFLSGPDPVAVTRANLTVFITAISIVGVVMLAFAGAITADVGLSATGLIIPFLFATWLGGKLFARLSDTNVRRLALVLMLCVGIVGLVI